MRYDCWFCNCGRIQPMDWGFFDWMAENPDTRRLIRVCQNCGATRMQWLDEYDGGQAICGTDLSDKIIDTTDDNEYQIIFDHGIRVPLKCGVDAEAYLANTYINFDYLREHVGTTWVAEAEKIEPGCCTVDAERLIRDVKDEDLIKSIAGYVSGIDWTGTKYER